MGIEQQVKDTLSGFLQAFSHLQLEQMMKYFSEDATAYLPVHHRVDLQKDKNEIKEYFRWLHERVRALGVSDMGLVAEEVLVQLVGDVAVVTFKIFQDSVLRRTIVFKKTGDQWKIVNIHASQTSV